MIRTLDERDTRAFLNLRQIALTTDPDSFSASPEDDSPFYAEMVKARLAEASIASGDLVLGAFSPELIGLVSITQDKRRKRRHKAELHGMYVLPERRGEGWGKALLERSLETVRQVNGLEEIQLIVAVQNRSAVSLYKRFGFAQVWTEWRALKWDAHSVDAHHMILELAKGNSRPYAESTES